MDLSLANFDDSALVEATKVGNPAQKVEVEKTHNS